MNAENIKLGDLIAKILESVKGFAAREKKGCVVIAPVTNKPRYLKTNIPAFRTQRSPLELQSYYLFQALSATEPQPEHKRAWGTVASISSSTDSPQVGPINLKTQSVEAILCRLANEAGRTMWIALPKTEQTPGEWREPWRFVRYTEPDQVVRQQLRGVVESIPER
jgi:hypothetical protein